MTLTADEILAIPETAPERLFTDAVAKAAPSDRRALIEQERIALLKKWHPDRHGNSPTANAVSARIGTLVQAALDRLHAWKTPGLIELANPKGGRYQISFRSEHDITIGTSYVGRSRATFVVHKDHVLLAENATRMIRGIPYPNLNGLSGAELRNEMSRYFPEIVTEFETTDHVGFVVRKTDDVVCLRDVINYYKARGTILDPRHTAWIVSRLWNIASFMEQKGVEIVFPDFSPEAVFISPPHHAVVLLGGWWYAAKRGSSMKGQFLPARTLENVSPRVLKDKIYTTQLNGEAIKALGRELLGDISGVSLKWNPDLPAPMVEWLRKPAKEHARHDYREWRDSVLIDSYGPPKFIPLELTVEDVTNTA